MTTTMPAPTATVDTTASKAVVTLTGIHPSLTDDAVREAAYAAAGVTRSQVFNSYTERSLSSARVELWLD